MRSRGGTATNPEAAAISVKTAGRKTREDHEVVEIDQVANQMEKENITKP